MRTNEATNKQTSFKAPEDVPLDELRDIKLGENITTDIQPMDEAGSIDIIDVEVYSTECYRNTGLLVHWLITE